ncbi:MAG: polysaccharide biosynthesis/export family protein [Acidobacteriota bacterium]
MPSNSAKNSNAAGFRRDVRARPRWPAALCLVAALALPRLASAQSPDYVLGPRDIIAITVWDQLDMSGKFPIEPDGSFTFPLIGKVQAAGKTTRDVEAELKKRLRDGIFNDPQLTVVVESYVSQRVFIVGEVRTAGSYPMRGETTLIEALALAGSTTNEAAREVLIVRSNSEATRGRPVLPSEAKDAEVLHVDLTALQKGDLSNNVMLRGGDTIFVPRAEGVFVFGQVRSPGQYVVRSDTTVMQALSLAGGVTDRGALNRVRVVRIVGGDKKEIKVKLSDVVRPGDTLVVPERYF